MLLPKHCDVAALPVSWGCLHILLQFGNYISVQAVTGQQLIDALENGVSQVEFGAGRFPQVRRCLVATILLWHRLQCRGE